MYVSVPKNYSGNAFSQPPSQKREPPCLLPSLPTPPSPPPKPQTCEEKPQDCESKPQECASKPQGCAPAHKGGFDAEELLLIGLIALLLGREDCQDLVWMLAILLLA